MMAALRISALGWAVAYIPPMQHCSPHVHIMGYQLRGMTPSPMTGGGPDGLAHGGVTRAMARFRLRWITGGRRVRESVGLGIRVTAGVRVGVGLRRGL